MPGLNGLAFLEKLTGSATIAIENFRIYMISTLINNTDKGNLKKYNIRQFIDKPLSANKLRVLFN
jgi:hypothetical protein